MCYSMWYNAPTLLALGGLEAEAAPPLPSQQRGCIIPHAVTQFSSPEDGQKVAQNMLSQLKL